MKARDSTFYRSSQALEKNREKERHHWEDAGPTDSREQPKQNAAEQKEDGEVLADQAATEDVDALLDEMESTASALAHRLDIVKVNDLIDGIYGSVARLNAVGLLPVVCSACGIKLEAVIGAKLDSMQQHLDQDHQLNAVHLFAHAFQSGIQIKVHNTEIVGWFAKRCKIATLNKIAEGHVPCIQMVSSPESDQSSTQEVRQSNHQWLRDDVNTFIDTLYLKHTPQKEEHEEQEVTAIEPLLEELQTLNNHHNIDKAALLLDFQSYEEYRKDFEHNLKDDKVIGDWCAQFEQKEFFSEGRFQSLVAVLCVALDRWKNFYPRNAQILTVLPAYPKEDPLSDRD